MVIIHDVRQIALMSIIGLMWSDFMTTTNINLWTGQCTTSLVCHSYMRVVQGINTLIVCCVDLPYCPEQVPMGVHSSSTKKLRLASCKEEVLERFSYPTCEVSCQGTELTSIIALICP